MTDKKRRTCQICGRPYVPTSNVQKYCPDCRKQMQKDGSIKDAYLAYKKAQAPGPVHVTQIETPETHLMDFVETRQDVGNNESGGSYENAKYYDPQVTMSEEDEMNSGNGGIGATDEPLVLETPNLALPADLAFVEEAAEILRRYYRGELIDKEEFLETLLDKLDEL